MICSGRGGRAEPTNQTRTEPAKLGIPNLHVIMYCSHIQAVSDILINEPSHYVSLVPRPYHARGGGSGDICHVFMFEWNVQLWYLTCE